MMASLCLFIAALITACVNFFYLKARRLERAGQEKPHFFSIKETQKQEIFFLCIMITVLCGCAAILRNWHNNPISHDIMRICLLALLWPAAWIDFTETVIPNTLLKIGCIYWLFGLAVAFIDNREQFIWVVLRGIVAMLAIAFVCLICMFIIKGCIGMGDMKLMMVMGLLQGTTGLVRSIIMSMLVSFVICLVCLISRKKGRKDSIPFAPAILIGTTVSILLKGV